MSGAQALTNAAPARFMHSLVQPDGTAISHLRPVTLSIFLNESETTPIKSGTRLWSALIAMHSRHAVREGKSGPMVGSYVLSGPRNDKNVHARGFVQLDVDSEGEKDKLTGRLLRVTRSAPDFDTIKPQISNFEYVANSTHWHEPGIGANKYRITMLTDRDYVQDEQRPLLEALDELLGGSLDRASWAWSQAFFTPSCPPHASHNAFTEHNTGIALPVDQFVSRGRKIIAARQQSPIQPKMDVSRQRGPLPETRKNIQLVGEMLNAIPASSDRATWLRITLAMHSLDWACGEQLTRDWSQTCSAKWSPQDFASVWTSYDPSRTDAVGVGTLEHLARMHGYVGSSLHMNPQFDGKGADVTNGKMFADMWRGKLLHIYETGEWLRFDPCSGWIAAAPLEPDRAAKQVYEGLRQEAARQMAAGADDTKIRKLVSHIEYTSRASNLRAMIEMAKSEPDMTRRLSEFDADPMLLGVANGVLDLRTGQLRRSSPALLVSMRCPVDYNSAAVCPKFEQYLTEVQPEAIMRRFLQQSAGYCLTGLVTEQKFWFLYGGGENGKGVWIETLGWLLGDYAAKVQTEMFMQHQRNPQSPSPDIVGLKGKRLIFASETQQGQRLDAARVKELTGGDTLSGRVPYAKAAVTFLPTHKLVIVGNHKPDISDVSHGMWRRVLLVGFDQIIPESGRDKDLFDKLKGEGAGLLNWALEGLRQWRDQGLSVPDSVKRATADYRDEQDVLGEWIADNCITGSDCSVGKHELYADYTMWAQANGHGQLSQSKLTRRLNDRGFKLQPDKRTVGGLRLITPGSLGRSPQRLRT